MTRQRPTVRRAARSLALLAAAAIAGCESSGLSPRETAGRTHTSYLNALYADLPADAANTPAAPLRLPASVAVVQVGEVAPPAPLIDALRAAPDVFGRVESLSGAEMQVVPGEPVRQPSSLFGPTHPAPPPPPRPSLDVARRLAADLGMDYLLLVGGAIDHGTTATPLAVLDLTIVGAFVVPSREARGTASASAALIDVRAGRVLVSSGARATKSTLVTSVAADGEEPKLLERLRDDVLGKLGAQVVADTKARALRAGSVPAAAAAPAPAQYRPFEGAGAAAAEGVTVPAGVRY